jgi:hypothetical protein
MIHITITCDRKKTKSRKDPDILEIEIHGHAYADEPGKDLVCAGVSAVSITAMEALDTMFPDACQLEQQGNRLSIQVLNNSANLQTCLEMLSRQLGCFEEMYPEYVEIRQIRNP